MRLFGPMDLVIIPFMAIWSMAPIGGLIASLSKPITPESSFMQFFMTLFALIGLYMLVGRFVHEALRRRCRYFVVTSRRVIVISTLFPSSTQSMLLEEARNPEIANNSILFQSSDRFDRLNVDFALSDAKAKAQQRFAEWAPSFPAARAALFFDLKDPQEVVKIITDAVANLANINPRDPRNVASIEAHGENAKEALRKYEVDLEQIEEHEKDRLRKAHANIYIARTCGLAIGSMAALTMGSSAIYSYSTARLDSQASKAWPSVPGKISELEIRPHKAGGDYLSKFAIEFKVNGKAYQCEKYNFNVSHDWASDPLLAFARTHKVGDAVPVFYKPSDPSTSVIVNEGAPLESSLSMGVGFDFIGVAILLAIMARIILFAGKKFPDTEVKYGIGQVFYVSAFLSVWCTMFFGAMLAGMLGSVICQVFGIK